VDRWRWYTLAELRAEYKSRYSEKEVQEYWDRQMWSEEDASQLQGGEEAEADNTESEILPCSTVEVEGSDGQLSSCRYLLLKPPNFECRDSWPVLLFLHGHGEIGKPALLSTLLVGTDALLDTYALTEFVVIAPLAERGTALLDPSGHSFAIDPLFRAAQAAVERLRPRADPGRVSATGYSMGADAAVQLASRHGDSLAAVAAFAGSYSSLWHEPWDRALAGLSTVSLRCYHNEGDNYLWSGNTESIVRWIGSPHGLELPQVQDVPISVREDGTEELSHVPLRVTEYQWGRKACWLFLRSQGSRSAGSRLLDVCL